MEEKATARISVKPSTHQQFATVCDVAGLTQDEFVRWLLAHIRQGSETPAETGWRLRQQLGVNGGAHNGS